MVWFEDEVFAEIRLKDEEAWAALDRRVEFLEHTVTINGSASTVPVLAITRLAAFGTHFREEIGLGDTSHPGVALIGAGLSTRMSVVWSRGEAAAQSASASAALRNAVEWATSNGLKPVALYVPPRLRGLFAPILECRGGRAFEHDVWSGLSFDSHPQLLTEWATLQPRRVRQTLARDIREFRQNGRTVHKTTITQEAAMRRAELFSSVAENNGLTEDPRLVAMRLMGLNRRPGSAFFLDVRENELLVGVTACRQVGDYLDVQSVGLAPNPEHRRSRYHSTTFVAPLDYAVTNGVAHVGFGISHAPPKLRRGCTSVSLVSFV